MKRAGESSKTTPDFNVAISVLMARVLDVLLLALALSPMPALAGGAGQGDGPWIAPVTAYPDDSITVRQLENKLAALRGKSDREMAHEIAGLELSERLSTGKLEKLAQPLPGKRSAQALIAVADASSFLDLPESEQPRISMPDRLLQGEIVSRAADFVARTVSKMPDFIATKTTTRFQSVKHFNASQEPVIVIHRGFQFIDRSEVITVYRDGNEVEETPQKGKAANGRNNIRGLHNTGIFGPLLASVMMDVLKGRIGWSHWEETIDGPAAVFRFAVPEDKSTYTVSFCCVSGRNASLSEFKATPAYHGEIAINPNSGAIMRIVLKTDLKVGIELTRMDLAVDYGRVTIGGRSFICPVRGVSIANVRELVKEPAPTAVGRSYMFTGGPMITAINDTRFDNYHQFRSDIKILPFDATAPSQ